MGTKINLTRYRLVLLLYLVFICLSLLTVPKSLLEGNISVINTLSYQEKLLNAQIKPLEEIGEKLEQNSDDVSFNNFTNSKTNILNTYQFLDSVDIHFLEFLTQNKTSILGEFSKKGLVNKYFEKDSLVFDMKMRLFDMTEKVIENDSLIGRNLANEIPVQQSIVLSRSSKRIDWHKFYFIDRPTSVAYMHLKRIKLLLLQTYIDIQKNYILKAQQNQNLTLDSIVNLKKIIEKTDLRVPQVINEKIDIPSEEIEKYIDDIPVSIKNEILNNFELSNLFVGIPADVLINKTNTEMSKFSIDISPKANVKIDSKKIQILFKQSGRYNIKMYFESEKGKKLLMERKLTVDKVPDPFVSLQSGNSVSTNFTLDDLSKLNSLTAVLPLKNSQNIPVIINGFRATLFGDGKQKASFYNYGAAFQSGMKDLLSLVSKGDLLLLDNITVALGDGSTRTVNPIIYKMTN